MRPYELLNADAYKQFLQALRDDRCIEYGLRGWDEIGDWLVRMRFTVKRPTENTLRKWRRQWCMPVARARVDVAGSRRVPWATNLQMHAWLATQGQVMLLPRWHPARGTRGGLPTRGPALTLVAGKLRPSTMRMRKTRARRRAQRIALARMDERVVPAAEADAARSPSTSTAPPQGRIPRGYEGGSEDTQP